MPRATIPALLLTLAVLATTALAIDVAPRWQAGGPEGGAWTLTFARSDPDRVYAATGGGVVVSTDAGLTWRPTGVAGLEQLEITALAVDPLDADCVYLGLSHAGVFRSDDGGRTWQPAREGLSSRYPWLHAYKSVGDLAPSRDAPGTVFAKASESEPWEAGTPYISRDRGAHWTQAVGIEGIDFVEIAPWSPQVVYVGEGSGVQRSDDGGLTWEGVPGLQHAGIHAMAFGPAGTASFRGTIWAGAAGVYRSTDGGQTWSRHTEGLDNPYYPPWPVQVLALAADASNPLRVYAGAWEGTFRSADGGLTWSRLADPLGSTCVAGYRVAASPAPGGPVLTESCDASVLRLEDDAWVQSGAGLYGVQIGLLVVDPERPAVAYAAPVLYLTFAPEGLYRTTDGGRSWRIITGDLGPHAVYSLAMDPVDPRQLLVSLAVGEGLVATTDGGDTWATVDLPGAEPAGVPGVVFAPSDSSRVYGFRFADSPSWGSTEVLRSSDGGRTWEGLPLDQMWPPEPQAVAVDPRQPDTLYAGMSVYGGGVSKSTDSGGTWIDSSAGLPWLECWAGPCPDTVTLLSIHPDRPERIWAVTRNFGLWVSGDAGASWRDSSAPAVAGGVALVRDAPDTVLVGDKNTGQVVVSTDGGTTWSRLGQAVDPAPGVFALAASPSGDLVYAGTTASVLHLHQPSVRRPGGRARAGSAATITRSRPSDPTR